MQLAKATKTLPAANEKRAAQRWGRPCRKTRGFAKVGSRCWGLANTYTNKLTGQQLTEGRNCRLETGKKQVMLNGSISALQ